MPKISDGSSTDDTPSTTSSNTNFAVAMQAIAMDSSIASSSRNNSITDDPTIFSDEQPRSPIPGVIQCMSRCLNSFPDVTEVTWDSDPSNLPPSNLPGPSSSSDLPGPSISYGDYRSTESTEDADEVQQIRRLFTNADSLRIFDEHSSEILRPIDAVGRNAMNDTDSTNPLHMLSESSDVENDDNNDFLSNSHPSLDIDSTDSRNNFDTNADQSISTDQLFAPEESSNSSTENSPLDTSSPFLPHSSTCAYFRFLANRQTPADEHPLLRTSPRFRRHHRPPLSLTDLRDRVSSDMPVRLGTNQGLSSYLRSRLMNSRYRMRYSHANLFSRHKTTATLNAVTSNEDGENLTNGNELRDLNTRSYRRNFCLSKLHNESRLHSHPSPSDCDTSRYHRISRPDRFLNRPAFLRSIIDFENSLRTFPRPPTFSVRARSVSPTSASPTISASVHDEPLDDIGINLRSDNSHNTTHRFLGDDPEEEISRPDSPLPPALSPTLSDDEMEFVPLTSGSVENEIQTPILAAAERSKPTGCRLPLNLTINSTDKEKLTKEAPQTYEELNSELIQLLECPICFEYNTPPINQCLQGHIICNNCRQRVTACPTCRASFQDSRNLVMEKVAALLRYPCKNAVTGCVEFLYLHQKEQHEMGCGFRQYVCFLPLCNWRGYKPELFVHVQEAHKNHVIHGPSTNLLIPVNGQTKKVWLMSAFNELFYVIFFTTLGILKGSVRFIGDHSKCDSYTYNISVTSEEDMLRNFNYTRTTHAHDESFQTNELLDSYDLFSISHAQLNLFRKGSKAPIRVTIEEAQKRTGLSAPTSSSAN